EPHACARQTRQDLVGPDRIECSDAVEQGDRDVHDVSWTTGSPVARPVRPEARPTGSGAGNVPARRAPWSVRPGAELDGGEAASRRELDRMEPACAPAAVAARPLSQQFLPASVAERRPDTLRCSALPAFQAPVVNVPVPELALFKWTRNRGQTELRV